MSFSNACFPPSCQCADFTASAACLLGITLESLFAVRRCARRLVWEPRVRFVLLTVPAHEQAAHAHVPSTCVPAFVPSNQVVAALCRPESGGLRQTVVLYISSQGMQQCMP
jgi:hypothetical protein